VASLAAGLGLSLEQIGLRLGMLSGALLPFGAFFCLRWLYRSRPHPVAVIQPGPALDVG
jgi:hypothetical protein